MFKKLKIGSLIYYTSHVIALMVKPSDAGDLWKVGLLINYKSDMECTILNSDGVYEVCPSAMIMTYPDEV